MIILWTQLRVVSAIAGVYCDLDDRPAHDAGGRRAPGRAGGEHIHDAAAGRGPHRERRVHPAQRRSEAGAHRVPQLPAAHPRSHTNPVIPVLLASLSDDDDGDGEGEGQGQGQGAEVKAPYRIAEVPSKGLGMLATRAIPQGAFITAERPLLLGPQAQHLDGHNMQFSATATARQRQRAAFTEAEKNLRIAFARMAPANQTAYTALHNAHQSDGSGPITGVMRTNAYEVCRLEGRTYAGVFKDLSRVNHR
ncbi:hypothetical protein PTI98_012531 [Pleurotus ostreatus]|nr:hypothetical protein PTI98_012531 [Pleurotus ostreatus]